MAVTVTLVTPGEINYDVQRLWAGPNTVVVNLITNFPPTYRYSGGEGVQVDAIEGRINIATRAPNAQRASRSPFPTAAANRAPGPTARAASVKSVQVATRAPRPQRAS